MGNYCINGTWTERDLRMQMIVYSNINAWRTALMMQIAEREKANGRAVLFFTENPFAEHLTMPFPAGSPKEPFYLYRPGPAYQASDIDTIIDYLSRGKSVIFDTNKISTIWFKHEILANMVAGLSGEKMSITNLTMVFESCEQFYGRQYNYGDRSAIGMFKVFIDRCKAEGAHVIFAAQSSRDIPKEIATSCGTSILGLISNNLQATNTSTDIHKPLLEYLDRPFGLSRKSENDFFIFSKTTSPEEGMMASDLPEEMFSKSVMEQQVLPSPARLHDIALQCSFDPRKPKASPEYKSSHQDEFQDKILEAREEVENSIEPNEIDVATQESEASTANDNQNVSSSVATKTRKTKPTKFTDPQSAIAMLRSKGFSNPKDMVMIGLKVVSVQKNVLNSKIPASLTPTTLVRRLVRDERLREAIETAKVSTQAIHDRHGFDVNVNSYASAYYQALKNNAKLARKFNAELLGDDSSQDIAQLRDSLEAFSKEADDKRRTEAQYRSILSTWKRYAESKTVKRAA